MTIHDEITVLANQIANAGSKPSVALIKAKLNKKVPLPIIISTLKVWRHEPGLTTLPEESPNITEEVNTVQEADIFQQKLNEELAQMKREIIELKDMIKLLIDQNKS